MPDHALGAYMSNDTSHKPTIRTVAIVLAAVIAAGTPIIQALTGTLSVGQSDLVTSGDATLRAGKVTGVFADRAGARPCRSGRR